MTLRVIGIAMLLLCIGLFYVAFDQYQGNAANVREMNKNPEMRALVGGEMTPTMPATGKYAIVFGILIAIGGSVSLFIAARQKNR
ncbi:MAG TPA: hypothetical protein VG269_10735 [Tepidisphaeraceae bacterium]|jgi:hypothetical protein|nr:hypothetical protein [Tepidisphaeraceae bacterium]